MKDALLNSAKKLAPPAESANLNIWVDLMKKELSADAWQQVYPFYNGLIINIPGFTAITDFDLTAPLSNRPDHLHGNGTQK